MSNNEKTNPLSFLFLCSTFLLLVAEIRIKLEVSIWPQDFVERDFQCCIGHKIRFCPCQMKCTDGIASWAWKILNVKSSVILEESWKSCWMVTGVPLADGWRWKWKLLARHFCPGVQRRCLFSFSSSGVFTAVYWHYHGSKMCDPICFRDMHWIFLKGFWKVFLHEFWWYVISYSRICQNSDESWMILSNLRLIFINLNPETIIESRFIGAPVLFVGWFEQFEQSWMLMRLEILREWLCCKAQVSQDE